MPRTPVAVIGDHLSAFDVTRTYLDSPTADGVVATGGVEAVPPPAELVDGGRRPPLSPPSTLRWPAQTLSQTVQRIAADTTDDADWCRPEGLRRPLPPLDYHGIAP